MAARGGSSSDAALTQPPARRLSSLTALRALAAAAVFGRHAAALVKPGFPQGGVGVSFFFMLSGFVLAWSYRPGDRAIEFYRRRFARIYPAYLVATILGVVTYAYLVDGFSKVPRLGLLAVLALVQSWSPHARTYYAINGVSWSLSSEVFFYAMFPLVITRLVRLGTRGLAIGLGSLAALGILIPVAVRAHGQVGTGFWIIYIFPPVRMIEFVMGILLALSLRRGVRPRVGLAPAAALAVVAFVAAGLVPIYLRWVAITIIPFALLIAAAAQSDLDDRPSLLRQRALIVLGQWSFAFYLIHQQVLNVARKATDGHHLGTPARAGLLVACLALSVAGAGVIFVAVERPLERRLRGDRTLSVSAGGSGHEPLTG
ncbi:MAG: acyltransferase family protein [Acidimicrobiales bacterium]